MSLSYHSIDSQLFQCSLSYRVSKFNYDQISSSCQFFIVGTFERLEVVKEVWDELKIALSKTNHKISEFGQSILVSISGDDYLQKVESIIKYHHGDIIIEDQNIENQIILYVSALAPTVQVAREVTHNMELYRECNNCQLFLRPPWLTENISEQQRETEYKARYTYAQLAKLSQPEATKMLKIALLTTVLSFILVWPLNCLLSFLGIVVRKITREQGEIRSNTWYGSFFTKIDELVTKLPDLIGYYASKGFEERKARIILNTPDPRIDSKTVELSLERYRERIHQQDRLLIGYYQPVTGATYALGQRLGQIRMKNGFPIVEDIYLTAEVGSIQQDEKNLVFSYIGFRQTHEGAMVFIDYLCKNNFGDIKYKFFIPDEY